MKVFGCSNLSLLIFVILCLPNFVFGQDVHKGNIKFLDALSKAPVSYLSCNIQLTTVDTLIMQNHITKETGEIDFKFPKQVKKLRIIVQSTLYKLDTTIRTEKYLPPKKGVVNFGEFLIDIPTERLQTVEITERATIITPQKRSFSAKSFKTSGLPLGKNLLTQIPGISFTDNSYKVDGSLQPIFYLNGSKVLQQTVENLPINLIDRVEIINSSPLLAGLKHDQVIINIRTKKTQNTIKGGIAMLNAAFNRKNYGAAVNAFITGKKTFLNFMVNTYTADIDLNNKSNWFNRNGKGIYQRSQIGLNNTSPIFANISLNTTLAKNVKLNYSLFYSNIKLNQNSSSVFDRYLPDSSKIKENAEIDFTPKNVSNAANVSIQLNDSSSLFFRGWYGYDKTSTRINLTNSTGNNIVGNVYETKSNNLSFLAGHDFEINKLGVEFGALYQQFSNLTDFSTANSSDTQNGVFEFKQDIVSAYLKLSHNFGKLHISLNNRFDQSSTRINNNPSTKRFDYLPSLNLFYKSGNAGSFSLSVSRDLETPNNNDLNSAGRSTTESQLSRGNTGLSPQIETSIRLRHNIGIKKLSLNNSLVFNHTKSLINYGPYHYEDATGVLLREKINLNELDEFYINPSLNWKATKKINLKGDFKLGRYALEMSKPNPEESKWELNGWYTSFNVNIAYTIGKGFKTSSSLEYTNYDFGPFERNFHPYPSWSFKLSKYFSKQSLTINASVYDILNKGNYRRISYLSPDIINSDRQFTSMRSFGISISYFFGNKKALMQPRSARKGIGERDSNKPTFQ